MASVQSTELSLFAGEVGKDVKSILTLITGAANITSLEGLKTNTKANLVAALNEVFDAVASAGSGGAAISDGTTSLTTTWSSSKINASIGVVATQVQNILAASPQAYDTFKEVADYIAADVSGANAMLASIANRIRVDADQTFTSEQIGFGIANLVKLGAAKQSDLTALTTSLGDLTVSYKTIYTNAKNS
jgi:type I restriction-modification system DNA methylase subunit